MSTKVLKGKTMPKGGTHKQTAAVGRGGGPWALPQHGRKRYAADPTPTKGGPAVGYLFGKHD